MTSLPIDSFLNQITHHILGKKPVILHASPGSGKTTRAPAALLQQLQKNNDSRKIIVIVPKRISILSATARICEENHWSLGKEVGYMVRFESKTSDGTQLIFMTDGMFLKKYNDSHFMQSVGFIFLDEFHERKSNMDLILGLSFERKIEHDDLQIVVMSATMDVQLLKKYFGEAEVIQIQSAPFKIEINYADHSQRLICDQIFYEQLKTKVIEAWNKSQRDILIFLPGLKEIRKAQEVLQPRFPHVRIDVLHGSLSLEVQKNIVFKNHNDRRLILTTNVAESSITIPEVDAVVDSGLEKNVIVEKKMGFSRLKLDRISLFSAQQREGRAGRTQNGFCFKLWHPVDERSMPTAIEPEIIESSLHDELLFLSSIGIQNFSQFSWLTAPSANQIQRAHKDLLRWELIGTERGRWVSQSPLSLRHSILFIELIKQVPKDAAVNLMIRIEELVEGVENLDQLMELPLTFTQQKLQKSLTQFLHRMNIQHKASSDTLEVILFRIFSHYFPERIIAKKSVNQGLSSTGRGVELKTTDCDFYAALSGDEKSDAVTLIKLAIGIAKTEALKILSHEAQHENKIFFDETNETFFKQETLYYGAFKLNEKSKERLSIQELTKTWKKYAIESPDTFLNLNSTFSLALNLIRFLERKKDLLQLSIDDFSFLENFENQLIQKMTALIENFEEFKTSEILHYLDDIVPSKVIDCLHQLPKNLKLPSGRTVEVNYEDPKAPLISSKIQDFFGWNETPQILGLKTTLELLAPNRRPAQTTNDLAYFWKNSYLDVRKDLRARYPKHAWPEDPTKL